MREYTKRTVPDKFPVPARIHSVISSGRDVSNQTLLGIYDNAPAPTTKSMPDGLRQRIEALTGTPQNDVRITYNSEKPAAFGAAAYTKGREIYIAPGADNCLEHEAGHIVQQSLGLVKPSGYRGGEPFNNDPRLEQQASAPTSIPLVPTATPPAFGGVIQCKLMDALKDDDQSDFQADAEYDAIKLLATEIDNSTSTDKLEKGKNELVKRVQEYLDTTPQMPISRRKNIKAMLYSDDLEDALVSRATEIAHEIGAASAFNGPGIDKTGKNGVDPKSLYKNIHDLERLKKDFPQMQVNSIELRQFIDEAGKPITGTVMRAYSDFNPSADKHTPTGIYNTIMFNTAYSWERDENKKLCYDMLMVKPGEAIYPTSSTNSNHAAAHEGGHIINVMLIKALYDDIPPGELDSEYTPQFDMEHGITANLLLYDAVIYAMAQDEIFAKDLITRAKLQGVKREDILQNMLSKDQKEQFDSALSLKNLYEMGYLSENPSLSKNRGMAEAFAEAIGDHRRRKDKIEEGKVVPLNRLSQGLYEHSKQLLASHSARQQYLEKSRERRQNLIQRYKSAKQSHSVPGGTQQPPSAQRKSSGSGGSFCAIC